MAFKASLAADWITQKVGMSIEALEGYILCALYVALEHRSLLATVYRS